MRRGEYYVTQEQSKTDAELLKDKSKYPHIVVATPDHLNAVQDNVLGWYGGGGGELGEGVGTT